MIFRISGYATISTQTSVFIIGGWNRIELSSIIAEFSDYQWSHFGNLQTARNDHSAISVGSLTFIIGGLSADGKP